MFQQKPKSQGGQDGFILGIDGLYNLAKDQRQIRLVYSVTLDKRLLVQPRVVDTRAAEADQTNIAFNKVFFNIQHIVKGY